MLQTFTITADVPEGFEVARFGLPKKGDLYLHDHWGPTVASFDFKNAPQIILRPVWKWPEFIRPGCWIAMDRDGVWCLAEHEPTHTPDGDYWFTERGKICHIDMKLVNFTPPHVTDWKLSKRQKPQS